MKETKIASTLKYQCSFLELYEDQVLLPNQNIGTRVIIKHVGGACVLPVTSDNQVILTKQYRYPISQVSIEIPAGKKDHPTEDSLTCAKRELEEETGYISKEFSHLFTLHPCVGYSDEKLDIYLAKKCVKINNPKAMDEDEMIDIMLVDKTEIKRMINDGMITDGKTLIALQYFVMNL